MSMKYGTTVTGASWNDLMNAARNRTNLTGEKTKVVAVCLSNRAARIEGTKYQYVICLPETSHFRKKCAKAAPNGKPCLLDYDHYSPYHISRGSQDTSFLMWTFVSEVSRQAVRRSTNSIVCETLSKERAMEMGFKEVFNA